MISSLMNMPLRHRYAKPSVFLCLMSDVFTSMNPSSLDAAPILLGGSILLNPLLNNLIERRAIILILIGNACFDRVVGLRINEDLTDKGEDVANTVWWFPVVTAEDTQTNAALFVVCDIWVIDFCFEGDDGGFEGVFLWECHLESEDAALWLF